MNHSTPAWSPAQAQALAYAWEQYRVWAATSRQKKTEIFSWKLRVLVLTIVGAILGAVSSRLSGISDPGAWSIGIAGGVFVALATYLSREILSPDQERRWIRARSMAETLKAEIFLFRTTAAPYDVADPAPKLMERVQEHLANVEDMQSATLSADEQRQGLPEGPLSLQDYIRERLDDQVEHFYWPRVQQYDRLMKRWRNVNLALGALATVLGVLGKWTGTWVAVITTVTTAVAAYLYANRYQYLIISYQATARQLEFLKHQWVVDGAPEQDQEKRNQFLQACEEAISIENNAWMAKFIGKSSE
jgi:hypothetical protein